MDLQLIIDEVYNLDEIAYIGKDNMLASPPIYKVVFKNGKEIRITEKMFNEFVRIVKGFKTIDNYIKQIDEWTGR